MGFPIIGLSFNNNDSFFASASNDGSICVTSLGDKKTLFSFSDQSVILKDLTLIACYMHGILSS